MDTSTPQQNMWIVASWQMIHASGQAGFSKKKKTETWSNTEGDLFALLILSSVIVCFYKSRFNAELRACGMCFIRVIISAWKIEFGI